MSALRDRVAIGVLWQSPHFAAPAFLNVGTDDALLGGAGAGQEGRLFRA